MEKQVPAALRNSTDTLRNSTGSSSSPQRSSQPTSFPSEIVQELMSLGNFTLEQVEQALRECFGDKNQAATYLLSKYT